MKIYLDHAATTPVAPQVLKAMLPYFNDFFANPDSLHSPGLEAKQALDQARRTTAEILNCSPQEIVFTSGGTESNNLALIGYAQANIKRGKHIITVKTEHSSIINTCKHLEKQGFEITYLDVNNNGSLNSQNLKDQIRPDTTLISIMYANNEIGIIHNLSEIADIAHEQGINFHSDACQAAAFSSLDTKEIKTDMLTLNGSKIYGPKGVGVLYIKSGTCVTPILHGGEQEFGIRSGTPNLSAIIGFATALKLVQENKESESKRLTKLRDILINLLLKNIPGSKLNGSQENRLPNNVNIQFPNQDGKELLLQLDAHNIYCSTGAACSTSKENSSHVLLALGLTETEANSSLRFTLGHSNNEEQIQFVTKILQKIYQKRQ